MDPLVKEKRDVVVLVPYRSVGEDYEFYLQKRDGNAPTHANMFSMFGGGIEKSENLMQALQREIDEELSHDPHAARYFTRCERSKGIFHVFIEQVGDDFEQSVVVQEGEYGSFLKIDQLGDVPVSAIARLVVTDLDEWLRAERNSLASNFK